MMRIRRIITGFININLHYMRYLCVNIIYLLKLIPKLVLFLNINLFFLQNN